MDTAKRSTTEFETLSGIFACNEDEKNKVDKLMEALSSTVVVKLFSALVVTIFEITSVRAVVYL